MSTVTATPEPDAEFDAPALRSTVYALTGGSFLLVLGVAALVWVWGALRFLGEALSAASVWPAFGILAMTTLALLFFAYGWALLVRGLTDVVARGVAEGLAR